jgi:hypothetical protein
MNTNELFSEFMNSKKPKEEWTPDMEEKFRDTHQSHYDEGGWSDIWKQISKQQREQRLQQEKVFGKPKSKYHR